MIDRGSRFDPDAVSPNDARGLGQLMPATAVALGVADAFDRSPTSVAPRGISTAQLAAFGRVDLALAAYNAGPHRVTRYTGVPPFRETRDYVARITRAADQERAGSGVAVPIHVAADFVGPTPMIARAETGRSIERVDLGRAASPFSTPKQGTVLKWPS
ncbi:MAG: lytic transglycosylase domain-containing protein [Rhodovulum sulfidophilum]|uniref:Lytic transglycosylase domain-containing protein n=1 Tax=Rhodovulum sulfidophilum TaxID=35806 RepID=A0A2W5PUY0_RHOSU|nr:MAG: lytic transglycosylase domain-containing protein [Rhodovulum sulfidophilum]